ncbi:hypothetical protein N4R57_08705 [Rhodobacteraceae bacterium D3-12]|nr:hypothetical protein N4R57_08705 [Rhodobacteraceae bacterium D3-12]
MQRPVMNLVNAAICGLAVWATPVQAGPDRFSILLGSKHIGASGFHEVNPGVFATWEGEKLGYSIGAYVNSYKRGSVAVAAHLPLFQWEKGGVSAFGGLAWYPGDGHRFKTHLGNDIVGIGGLELRHGHVYVQFLPNDAGGARGLVTLGLTWDVGQ